MAKGKNSRKNKRSSMIGAFLAGVLFLFALGFGTIRAVRAEEKVIRVACVDINGVTQEEDGSYSGYTVDYLTELVKYTDWEIEYHKGSWTECMEMLLNGELDLIGMVGHTTEREEHYLYSELPMAHDYIVLCANTEEDICYQEYELVDGRRVGILENSIHEEKFDQYMQKIGITYEPVYFVTQKDAENALAEGSIDFMLTDNITLDFQVKLVDQFHLMPLHFVTGKQNAALMEELDEAMQEMNINNPKLMEQMEDSYYSVGVHNGSLLLTREEENYIASVGEILVKGFDGRRPLGYTEDGVFVGILSEYLNMLGEISGLRFRHEKTDIMDMERHVPLMEQENYAVIYVYREDLLTHTNDGEELFASNAFFKTGHSYVKRQADLETTRDDYTFALIREMSYLAEMLYDWSEKYKIIYYDTSAECMEAVRSGEADVTIQDEYVVQFLLQKPRYADTLAKCESKELLSELCVYVTERNELLVGILNKTITALSEQQQARVASDLMLEHAYEYTLSDMIYEHKNWIVVSALLIIVVLILFMTVYNGISQLNVQRKVNDELAIKVQLDDLTGVYNRSYFFEHAREMIDKSEEEMYIVRVNIESFKMVNELYGEEKGDVVLREFAAYLIQLGKRHEILVGHFLADYFYLCIRQKAFEKIEWPRQFSNLIPDADIYVTYGVYPVGEPKDIPVSLMCDRANMANAAQGRIEEEYIRFFSDAEYAQMLREKEIEGEMERALEERQYCIFIQPKYDVETDRIVGGEALVRWKHPEKGMIPPGVFIELFEKNGFIKKLDYYIWEECCRFLSESRKKGLPVYPVSTNVSRIHFHSSSLKEKLMGLVEKYEIEPGDLELEITESICADDTTSVFKQIRELQKKGFRVAMDDFGSGYSSLNMLKEMPLDIIKMDLKFLTNEGDVEKGRYILRSLIELAQNLELQVVVEGLETKEQRDFIRKIGNCIAQGYYYSRPVETEIYEKKVREAMGQGV